ncbi:GGDEF domain-containing protein [Mangrovimicrobium sediminis]|uniref:GGDEF domain-containing protein n=1 Tax=Mangrovimicrobium sediminis TaxID=2562682 RepID=UPI0014366E56|nr:GGDEF domain-containing protein [Haliea sp. SAOS-164]
MPETGPIPTIEAARREGDLAKADQLANTLLDVSRAGGAREDEGRALLELAANARDRNDYPAALGYLEPAFSIAAATGEPRLQARAHTLLGQVYRFQARYQAALDEAYRAMEIYLELRDQGAIGDTYSNIGTTLERVGQYEPALNAHLQALEIHSALDDSEAAASDIYNLGHLYVVIGDYPSALGYFQDVLQLDLASGDVGNIAYTNNKLGVVFTAMGDYKQAREHLDEALRLFQSIPAPRDVDWSRSLLAELALAQGNLDTAAGIIDGVIQRSRAGQFNSLLIDGLETAGEIALRRGEPDLAQAYIDEGIERARDVGQRHDQSHLEKLRAEAYRQQGAWQSAYAALQRHVAMETNILGENRVAAMGSAQSQAEFLRRGQQIELLQNRQQLQEAQLEKARLNRRGWVLAACATFALLGLLLLRYLQWRLNRRLRTEVAARTEELSRKNRELEEAYQRMELISLTDNLTGLYNRHFLESLIDGELEHCLRQHAGWLSGKTARPEQADLVAFLIDIDHFKRVNDRHGHSAGDDVLIQFRERLEQVFRHSDFLVRWGGEEFVAIARFTDHAGARHLAQRLMSAIRDTPFRVNGDGLETVTCSVGYVCYPLVRGTLQQPDWQTIIRLGDLCLYAAKYSGRDTWIGLESFNGPARDIPVSVSGHTLAQWTRAGRMQLASSLPPETEIRWETEDREALADVG